MSFPREFRFALAVMRDSQSAAIPTKAIYGGSITSIPLTLSIQPMTRIPTL